MDIYVKKLIELDSRAVELKEKRESEIAELETQYRNRLRSFDNIMQEASLLAKKKHDEIIGAARNEARLLDDSTTQKLKKLQNAFDSFKEDAAREIWKQLLSVER